MYRKILLILLCYIPLQLQADAINTEELFSDSFQGYAYNPDAIYWYEENKAISYSDPDLTSMSVEVELNPICVEGGGGDCAMGVLYKKLSQDAKGNYFYLVKDKNQKDVWVQSNNWEARDFDERMIDNSGMDIIFSPEFDATDTSLKDGVPSVENERNKQIKKILQQFSPELGEIRFELPIDAKPLRVKDSHVKPEGKFLDYPLSKESYYFREDTNSYIIQTTMFKRQGNYMVVELYSIPEVTLNVPDYDCAGPDSNYVWLDAKGLDVEFIKHDVSYAPIENLLGEFGRSYSVKEIKEFNGNRYALILEHLNIKNPLVEPDENRVKEEGYTVPYKWVKIRDNKNRLRFWFASYSC